MNGGISDVLSYLSRGINVHPVFSSPFGRGGYVLLRIPKKVENSSTLLSYFLHGELIVNSPWCISVVISNAYQG